MRRDRPRFLGTQLLNAFPDSFREAPFVLDTLGQRQAEDIIIAGIHHILPWQADARLVQVEIERIDKGRHSFRQIPVGLFQQSLRFRQGSDLPPKGTVFVSNAHAFGFIRKHGGDFPHAFRRDGMESQLVTGHRVDFASGQEESTGPVGFGHLARYAPRIGSDWLDKSQPPVFVYDRTHRTPSLFQRGHELIPRQ